MGVSEHYENSVDITPPKVCPSCGSEVIQEGPFLYCANKDKCAPRLISEIVHFASKPCMDIEGLSEKTVEQLYNELGVDTPDKLYTLTKEQLLTLEGFKDKKAQNLLDAINNSRLTTLDRFIFALGIPGIGKKAAKQLAQKFKTLDNVMAATAEQIIEIDDFGSVMTDNTVNFFADQNNRLLIKSLLDKGIAFEKEEEPKEGVLSGRVVVLTGSLRNYKRSQAAEIIKDLGGEVSDTVTKSVNLVIAGEEAGSKLAKAQKLGIEIRDEEWFLKIIEENKKG
jgi:DNA ligase (NAD+)